MNMIKFAPALQIVIPLITALISALSFHKFTAWIITVIGTAICLLLSLYCMQHVNNGLVYIFGSWSAPIGVEYKLDLLNQPVIFLLNVILFFYLGEQQLSESSQQPSLQQLLLHCPVSQPSLQQPSAQQVYLQHVSIVSFCSIIIVLYSIILAYSLHLS